MSLPGVSIVDLSAGAMAAKGGAERDVQVMRLGPVYSESGALVVDITEDMARDVVAAATGVPGRAIPIDYDHKVALGIERKTYGGLDPSSFRFDPATGAVRATAKLNAAGVALLSDNEGTLYFSPRLIFGSAYHHPETGARLSSAHVPIAALTPLPRQTGMEAVLSRTAGDAPGMLALRSVSVDLSIDLRDGETFSAFESALRDALRQWSAPMMPLDEDGYLWVSDIGDGWAVMSIRGGYLRVSWTRDAAGAFTFSAAERVVSSTTWQPVPDQPPIVSLSRPAGAGGSTMPKATDTPAAGEIVNLSRAAHEQLTADAAAAEKLRADLKASQETVTDLGGRLAQLEGAAGSKDVTIADLSRQVAAEKSAREAVEARVEAIEKVRRVDQREAMLGRHAERGAVADGDLDAYRADVDRFGVDAVDAMLSRIPAGVVPLGRRGLRSDPPHTAAVDLSSMARIEAHAVSLSRTSDGKLSVSAAMGQIEREHPEEFQAALLGGLN